MGFMTEVSILNDSWHELRKNPQQLVDAIAAGMDKRVASDHAARGEYIVHVNAVTVQPSHHADEPRLYIAWRNSFVSLDKYNIEREFGDRLNDPRDHLLRVIEEEIAVAESKLKSLKSYLKEKKAQVAA